ncbi:MAG: xanthine dehydrogenase small subunit [Xanthomonadales bacterium]|nr:xanthine dehydrogenase small subunit [Xanthomonadales bacterium]
MASTEHSATGQTRPVKFILDGELIELHGVDPTRTVLQFLREDLRRTGTKEGCAEGDCGACTVALVELGQDGNSLKVLVVNSCIQFLPALDGKELITVESLVNEAGELHPVQQAIVDSHGSQCGFCTPGFVMSLFALYKNNPKPTRRHIDEALSGNLCRCTGYQPIVEAAQTMYQLPKAADDWLRLAAGGLDDTTRIERLKNIQPDSMLQTGRDGRAFFTPLTLAELIDLKRRYPDATLLAGGTDVGLWVTKQQRQLDHLIYTGRVPELLRAGVTNDCIEIGAALPISEAAPLITRYYPDLDELFTRFASPPVRNVATLGGNIANGSPIGDSMPALMVLETRIVLQGLGGQREMALEDFYLDYMATALEPDEVLVSIRIPLPDRASATRCYKVTKRFDQDISALCMAMRVQLDGDVVTAVRIAAGGLAAIPKRAPACEAAMKGQPWNTDTVRAGMQALAEDFAPIDDMRASAAYRFRCAQNLLRRFYLETTEGKNYSVYAYGR